MKYALKVYNSGFNFTATVKQSVPYEKVLEQLKKDLYYHLSTINNAFETNGIRRTAYDIVFDTLIYKETNGDTITYQFMILTKEKER